MQIHEVSDYMTWNMPPISYYVDQLLAEKGTMLLYGDAGAMKSWMGEYLGWCIATGSEWLGFRTTQARVLLVNFELPPLGYFWRLKNMNRHFTLPDNLSLYESSPGEMALINRAEFDRFAGDIRPIAPKVIILDCFQAFFGGDENSLQEVTTVFRYLKEIIEEHSTSIVIIHHTNKNELVSGMSRIRGTSGLQGKVDTVVGLVDQLGEKQLQFKKHRVALHQVHPINVKFEDYAWTRR